MEGAGDADGVIPLAVTHSGACARCKNLKVCSPLLSLAVGVLIEPHGDLLTHIGKMRVQGRR